MPTASPYRLNVNEQSEKLAEFLTQAESLKELGLELDVSNKTRIVFSGMGSSHFASYARWEAFTKMGLPAWWVPASELLDIGAGLLSPGTLLCLTSQSGESAEINQILNQFDLSKVTVLGITNNSQSTLAKQADHIIDVSAGPEATVSTKTYLNTLAAMKLFFSSVTNDFKESKNTLLRTVEALDKYLAKLDSHIEKAGEEFPLKKNYICVGRGEAGASAQTAALILKEAAKVAIEGTTSASFRHGPIELAGPNLCVTFFDHGVQPHRTLNMRLASDLITAGSAVTWIGIKGEGTPLPGPDREGTEARICDALSFQTLSFALASRNGVQAGDFAYASKVTDIL